MSRAALAGAVSLGLLACGNGDEAASSTSGPAASTIPSTTATPVATVPGGEQDSEFCQGARTYAERLEQLLPALGNPEEVRRLLSETGPAIDRAQATAPPDLKADVDRLAEASRRLLPLLEAAGYDFSKVDPAAVADIQNDEVSAAAQRLGAYTNQVCGVAGVGSGG
ncbi:MAG: hypothetical protein ACT4OS_09860 [Acidimicrobiales bacterium]